LVVEPDLWEVSADATQMLQMLSNLCLNARDAMPAGGTLTVTLETTTLDTVVADLKLETFVGPYVRVRVEDTGEGMPPEVVDRIFEPFFTTKDVGKGTGQGLTIARSIVVEKHGGRLDCRSVPGEGATFTIRLPLESPSGTPAPAMP
jgi:signal transduction histidine kinase